MARSVTDGQKRAIGRGKKSVRISAWVVGICWLLHSMCALFMWSKCLSESEIGSVTLFCILSVKLVDHFKSGLNVESTIRAGTACARLRLRLRLNISVNAQYQPDFLFFFPP